MMSSKRKHAAEDDGPRNPPIKRPRCKNHKDQTNTMAKGLNNVKTQKNRVSKGLNSVKTQKNKVSKGLNSVKTQKNKVVKGDRNQENKSIKGHCQTDISEIHQKHKHDKEKILDPDKSCQPIADKTRHDVNSHKTENRSRGNTVSSNWKLLQKDLKLTQKKKTRSKKSARPGNQSKPSDQTKKSAQVKTPSDIRPSPEIWFDDVDEDLLQLSANQTTADLTMCTAQESLQQKSANLRNDNASSLVRQKPFNGVTKVIAIDCEMVGVGEGGCDSIVARVSIVNQYGVCVYDELVKATEYITDYRTPFSGIHRGDLEKGKDFKVIQEEVSDILKDRTLVGHALQNDLKVLYLDHPKKRIRDTSRYKPFRALFNGRTPSLKNLTQRLLGVKVQEGEHNSVEDAQAAMRLYTMHRKQWEKDLKTRRKTPNKQPKK